MAEELKNLIEKIHEDGVKAAEKRAQELEAEARKKADGIIADAQKEASKIIEKSKEDAARTEKSGRELLTQAGRDLLLVLRKEINSTLEKLTSSKIDKELSSEELAKMLKKLIIENKGTEDIKVILSKEDLGRLEKGLLKSLSDETKNGITLKSSDDIRGGFLISYDKGKSFYDFTDKAIAEYIGSYLKPKLAEMLDGKSVKNKKA